MLYPSQIDSVDDFYRVANAASTTLPTDITADSVVINVNDSSVFPNGRFIVTIESELIIIESKNDLLNTLNVELRGAFGTTASIHIAASRVSLTFTAQHYELLRDGIIGIQKEIFTYRKPIIAVKNAAPLSPLFLDTYVVGLNPTGDWVNKENNIVFWNGSSWSFIEPLEGFILYNKDNNSILKYTERGWEYLSSGEVLTDVKNSNYLAGVNEFVRVDTRSNDVTITLPDSAYSGDSFSVLDLYGTFSVNNCILTLNNPSHKLQGNTDPLVLDIDQTYLKFVWNEETLDWRIKETPNLKEKDIGVIVQPFNSATVLDENYVHTDSNFTLNEKTKLAGIEDGAQVNVNADWESSSGASLILNKPITFTPSPHVHDASDITTGVIDIARLPASVFERIYVVSDDTERFSLTVAEVQNGDVVKVNSTELMYYVKDQTKLNIEDGYEIFKSGYAASVPWSGVTGKPSEIVNLQDELDLCQKLLISPTADNLLKTDSNGQAQDSGFAVSTDGTMASNSDAKLPTEKAVRTFTNSTYQKLITSPINNNIVTTDSSGQTKDSGLALSTITETNTFDRWVDNIKGSDTYSSNSQLFPFATIGRALTGAQYPLKIHLVGQSYTENIALTSVRSNITIGSELTVKGGIQTELNGTITTSSGFTRGRITNLTINSGVNTPVTLGSGDLGRHVFENVVFSTTSNTLISIPSNFTNWIDLLDCDLTSAPFAVLSLPALSGSAALTIKRLKGVLNISAPSNSNWTIYVDSDCVLNWVGGYNNTTVLYTGNPKIDAISVITSQPTLTSLLASSSGVGLYLINFASPTGLTGLARGDILYHSGANINAILYPFALAPSSVNVLGVGTHTKTANGWQLGGTSATWGSITGTLSSQTDLQTALDSRQDFIPQVASQSAMLALTGVRVGYIVIRTDLQNAFWRLNALPASSIGNWSQVAGSQFNASTLQASKTVYVDTTIGSNSNDGLTVYSKVATLAQALSIAGNNWVIDIVSNDPISYTGNISLVGLTIRLSPNTTLSGTIGIVSTSSVTFTGGRISATINDSSSGNIRFQDTDLTNSVITHSGSSSKFYQNIYVAPTSISTSGGTGTLFLSEIQSSVMVTIAGGWSIRKKDCQLQIASTSSASLLSDELNIREVLESQGAMNAVATDGLYAVNFAPSSPTGATSGSILERASGVWYIVELGFYAQPTISVGTTTKTTWVKISDKWYSLGQNVSQLNYMTCSIGGTNTRTASQAQMPLIQVVTSGNITVTGNGINLKGGRTYQLITNVYHNGSANWGSYRWYTTASGGSGSFGNAIAGGTVTFTGNESGGCNDVFVYSPASDTTIYLRESQSGSVYPGTPGGYSSIAVIDITPSPSIVVGNVFSTGDVVFSMATSKTGALICDGTLYSKSLYSDLWQMKNSSVGNVTISVASVAVFTLNSHGFVNGQAVYLTTTGALPSTLTQHRTYFVNVVTANTFNLATSVANLMARTYVSTTSTSQSGTHTVFKNFLQSWDIDNFFMDWRGFTIASISSARSGAYFGADTHQLLVSELASHNHSDNYVAFDSVSGTFATNSGNFRMTSTTTLTGGAGSNVPHNNLQPTVFCGNWFIFY